MSLVVIFSLVPAGSEPVSCMSPLFFTLHQFLSLSLSWPQPVWRMLVDYFIECPLISVCLTFLVIRFVLNIFGRNAIEVRLCSSWCNLSGVPWWLFMQIWLVWILITWWKNILHASSLPLSLVIHVLILWHYVSGLLFFKFWPTNFRTHLWISDFISPSTIY